MSDSKDPDVTPITTTQPAHFAGELLIAEKPKSWFDALDPKWRAIIVGGLSVLASVTHGHLFPHHPKDGPPVNVIVPAQPPPPAAAPK
jgi:hypothetical protein